MNALAEEKESSGMKLELDVGAAEVLGERSPAALYQIMPRRSKERCTATAQTFSVLMVPDQQRALSVTIRDDAPSRRRRRSIEVLEERARTLRRGDLQVEQDQHQLERMQHAADLRHVRRGLRARVDLPPLRIEAVELGCSATATRGIGAEVDRAAERRVTKVAPSPLPGDTAVRVPF